MSKQPSGSYPKSQYPGQYPVQQSYPTQGFTQYGVQQQYGMQQQQQMPQQPIQPSTTYGYPRQNMQQAGYGVPPPPYTTSTDAPTLAPTPYSNLQPVTSGYSPYPTAGYPPQMNVVNPVPTGVFDAGARFTAGATVNIPPPPPGAMPTAAQVAASQGQPVVMQQKQGSWFTGGSDGGTTFW